MLSKTIIRKKILMVYTYIYIIKVIFIKFLKFGLGLKRYQNKGNLIDYYVYISKNLLIPHVNQRDCSIDVFINFKIFLF